MANASSARLRRGISKRELPSEVAPEAWRLADDRRALALHIGVAARENTWVRISN